MTFPFPFIPPLVASPYRIGGATPRLVIDHTLGFYAEGKPLVSDGFTDIAAFARASNGYAQDAASNWQEFPPHVPCISWATGRRAHLIRAAATEPVP